METGDIRAKHEAQSVGGGDIRSQRRALGAKHGAIRAERREPSVERGAIPARGKVQSIGAGNSGRFFAQKLLRSLITFPVCDLTKSIAATHLLKIHSFLIKPVIDSP